MQASISLRYINDSVSTAAWDGGRRVRSAECCLVLLQWPAYRVSDSGRLLCFGRVIFSFCRPPIFRRPWADFRETLAHDAVCPEIVYLG